MKGKLLLCLLVAGAFSTQQAIAQNYIVIEDFEDPDETIIMNNMTGGESVDPDDVYQVVDNPDPDDVNNSTKVLQYTRANDGVPWGGFWSAIPEPLVMDDMQYIHYQVWKPVISPLRFKVEGSAETDDFEFDSMEEQTVTEGWETITFHYPDAAGVYPVIALMPDFVEREDLDSREEDYITMYIDNIILSDTDEDPLVTSADQGELPVQLALKQNYPNPFNPTTNITFELMNAQHVQLSVYDIQGQHIDTMVNEFRSAGEHVITFNAEHLPSGTYLYRLRTPERSITRMMTLIK